MKKILICILCVAAAGISKLQAQVPGVKGGSSITNVSGFNGDDRVTGHVGVFVHQTIDKSWCIQPEVLYAPMGAKYTGPLGGKYTLGLDYIQVPVMVQYYPISRLYFELGPQVAFLTSAKARDNDGNKVNVKDGYTAADFAVNFGVGVNVTRNIGFYGRYNLGVTDITKSDNNSYSNRGVQLGAAIRIH